MLKKYGQVLITLFMCSDLLLIFLIWVALYFLAGHLSSSRVISAEDFYNQIQIFMIFIPAYLISAQNLVFIPPGDLAIIIPNFLKS